MLPDLESIRCFVAACAHPTFRAAAQAVALSPAAFGERIRRFEESLDARLFERTTRSVKLTAAGRAVLPQAKRLLADAARLPEVAHGDSRAAPFSVSIGTRFELGLSWLVPSLDTLRKERPQRDLRLVFGDSPDLLAKIRAGTLDCAVSSARLTDAKLRYAVLHEERYVFVAAPALAAKRKIAKPADAAGHALLDVHLDLPLFRYFLDAAPRNDVWAFARVECLGTIAAVRARALEGAGVAVLPRYFVQTDLDRKKLAAVMPRIEPVRDYFRLIWLDGHPHEKEIASLARELRAISLS